MDLNSWRPEDTARRFAIMLATSAATFTFLAGLLAFSQPVWLSLLGGLGIGFVVYWPFFFLLRAIFRR